MPECKKRPLLSAAPDIRDNLTKQAPNKPRLGHLIEMCSKIESLVLLSIAGRSTAHETQPALKSIQFARMKRTALKFNTVHMADDLR
jgi:hypothetical protein